MAVVLYEFLDVLWSTIHGSLCLVIVFLFTVLLIFIRRVNTMVDIVSNRVFEAYSKFQPRSNNIKANREAQVDSLSTLNRLKRFSNESKQKRIHEREMEIKAREKHMVQLKENQMHVSSMKKRPLMGLICPSCTPYCRNSTVAKTAHTLSLLDILSHDPFRSRTGMIQNTFNHLSQVISCTKYDYPRVEESVLNDKKLRDAIEQTVHQQCDDLNCHTDDFQKKLEKTIEKRAAKLLHDMRSTLSHFLLSFTNWVMYKLLPCFMSSIIVHPGQIEMIKKASTNNVPMIFIPLHRSHLDYILVTFILLNNNIKSPLVAAGDNLRIPFFGSLLRGLGAFFIRRRMDPIQGKKDILYKGVLNAYMNNCLKVGHNIEFFLEGGRTRTGKPCMPKYGIFSVIIDAYNEGIIDDALLVPISMNYEKLIDGNFVREQLGEPKEMETFTSAIKGIWHVLNSNYGMMRIDFNQPFSLKELIRTFTEEKIQPPLKSPPNGINGKKLRYNASSTSLYGTDVSEENKLLVQSISKHVLYDCAMSTAIMSTNAVAFLLLNKYRNGTTIEELSVALAELKEDLYCAGRDVGFSGEISEIVNYAVRLLGPGLVRKEIVDDLEIIKPVTMLPNVIELAYYSNCLLQHFVLKSVIANAIAASNCKNDTLSQDEVIENTLELCNILQYEFLFCKPCQNMETTIMTTLDDFVMKGILKLNNNRADCKMSKMLEEELFSEEMNHLPQDLEYQLNTNENSVETLKFLRNILRPWIEAYSISALSLEKLVGTEMVEPDLVQDVLEDMKEKLRTGEISYGESVCVDPIKNSLKLFQHWDYLECHAEAKIRLLYLKDNRDNSDSVQTLYNKINKYRVVQ